MHLNRWNGNSFIHSFIYSGYFYSASSSPLCTTQRRSRHSTDTVPEFHAEAPQATVSEILDQGPYLASRAGVEPITLRMKGVDSTNAPHTSHTLYEKATNVKVGARSTTDLPGHSAFYMRQKYQSI